MTTKEAQEWLCHHGVGTAIDGVAGPAFHLAIDYFRHEHQIDAAGVLDDETEASLRAPIERAMMRPNLGSSTQLGSAVVAVAQQHLDEGPREIGGPNAGPFVRLYMDGNEGPAWSWCSGFTTYVLRQAHEAIRLAFDRKWRTFSCDVLALHAKEEGKLYDGAAPATIQPGSLFLIRRTATDWIHVGIVEAAGPEAMITIEGNSTLDTGSREGVMVCRRVRDYANKDFIVWAA